MKQKEGLHMFISNNDGEYIRMKNVIAIATEDKHIQIYTEQGQMRKEVEAFRPSFPLSPLMNKMKELDKVEFVRIGNYVFVTQAIDSVNWTDEGALVTTAQRKFYVKLTEAELEKATDAMRFHFSVW